MLKALRLLGWLVCPSRVLLFGKDLWILYLLNRSRFLTRRNSNQWESSFISWIILRTLGPTNIFPHYLELFNFLFYPKQQFWLYLNAPLSIQVSNTYLSSLVLKSVPPSLLSSISPILSNHVLVLFPKMLLSFRSPKEPFASPNNLLNLTWAITEYYSHAGWAFCVLPYRQLGEQKANEQQ